jgi:hypothetical protein
LAAVEPDVGGGGAVTTGAVARTSLRGGFGSNSARTISGRWAVGTGRNQSGIWKIFSR